LLMFDSREITRPREFAGPPEPDGVPLEARQLTRMLEDRPIINRIDVSISAGEMVALVGANGAGKTTLLRCLAGRMRPTAGEVLWYGASFYRQPARHQLIGFAGHESFLYLELTARQNLLFAARMCGVKQAEQRANEMLQKVGMPTEADQPAGRMSRGMRQRLSLSRALVHDPPIVILDEPFSGLDAVSRQWLEEWLAELRAMGRAILFTSHDEDQCRRIADRKFELKCGRLLATGTFASEKLSHCA
jgi:heme exporter protein A